MKHGEICQTREEFESDQKGLVSRTDIHPKSLARTFLTEQSSRGRNEPRSPTKIHGNLIGGTRHGKGFPLDLNSLYVRISSTVWTDWLPMESDHNEMKQSEYVLCTQSCSKS